jgi:hypothetical protein
VQFLGLRQTIPQARPQRLAAGPVCGEWGLAQGAREVKATVVQAAGLELQGRALFHRGNHRTWASFVMPCHIMVLVCLFGHGNFEVVVSWLSGR